MAESPAADVKDGTVWRLLLQYGWPQLEQQVVCRLLCCSKSMSGLVHATCTSRMLASYQAPVVACSQHAAMDSTAVQLQQLVSSSAQLAAWLSKHAELISSMTVYMAPRQHFTRQLQRQQSRSQRLGEPFLDLQDPPGEQHAHGSSPSTAACSTCHRHAVSAGLVSTTAAFLQQLWHLLPSTAPAIPVGCLHLLRNTLTHLDWSVCSNSCCRALAKALPSLQHLQALGLHCLSPDSGRSTVTLSALAPTLQQLSGLTSLHLQGFSLSTRSSRLLPDSLIKLSIGQPASLIDDQYTDTEDSTQPQHGQQLQLQHLTKLQQLQLCSLNGCDVLPEQLHTLVVGSCNPLAVLQLRQLQHLRVQADVPELLLFMLARRMHQFQDFQLACRGVWLTPSSMSHLRCLPLTHLNITCEMPRELLPMLGSCHQLQHLSLRLHADEAATQQVLSAQLLKLTALQSLSLSMHHSEELGLCDIMAVAVGIPHAAAMEGEVAEPVQATDSLCAAVLSLQDFRSLQLHGVGLSTKQQAQLAAATQLTVLQV